MCRETYPNFFDDFARVCSEAVNVITIDGATATGKGLFHREWLRSSAFRF